MKDAATSVAPSALNDENPWPGLDSYTEATSAWFHGRDADSFEMLRLVRQSPIVMLYGKSGLGKSSMLQAGVFPALRKLHHLPVYLRLDYTERAEQPPLQQALARLLQEAAAWGIDAEPPEPGEGLWAYLQRRERPLWSADNFPVTPVLVFDQFEEVFSRGGSPAHVKQVLDPLADLVGDRLSSELVRHPEAAKRLNLQSQQYRVVLSFRSDFLAEVESWHRQASLPKQEALHLKAMTRETAIDAVAKAGAHVLAPGVAPQIVDFVLDRDEGGSTGRATEVEPVLLSLCCYQLNNRRQPPAKIDQALLQSVGKDILLDFYREALAGTDPRVSAFIEDNLIQGGRYRSSFPREEALASGALTQAELDRLTERRLLRIDPQGDVPRIELIHDRLVGIVRDSKEARLAREQQAAQHEEEARLADLKHISERARAASLARNLLIGLVFALLLGSLGMFHFWRQATMQAAQARLEAQRADEQAKAARDAADAAEVAAGQARYQTVQAEAQKQEALQARSDADREKKSAQNSHRQAEALRLSLEGQSILAGTREGNDVQAFQQLLASQQLQKNYETRGALFDALVSRQHLRSLTPEVIETGGPVVGLVVSPDSRWLAIGHRNGVVSLRDLTNPQAPAQSVKDGHGRFVRSLVFNADGTKLFTGSGDGTLRRWRTQPLAPDGEPIKTSHGTVYGIALNRDGTQLASGGRDGTVQLWDASTGQALRGPIQLPQDKGPVWALAYRPSVSTQAAESAAGELVVASGVREGGGSYLVVLDTKTFEFSKAAYYAHAEDTMTLAISPLGRFAVSGSRDNTLRVRDLMRPVNDAAGSVRIGGHQGDVRTVAVSPDSRWVASGGADNTVRLWRVGSGEALGLPLLGHSQAVTAVTFSADGRWLVSGSRDGTVRLWPTALTAQPRAPEWKPLHAKMSIVGAALGRAGQRSVYSLRSDEDRSKTLLLLRDEDKDVVSGGEVLVEVPTDPAAAGDKPLVDCKERSERRAAQAEAVAAPVVETRAPTAIAATRDGSTLAMVFRDGSLRRWDLANGKALDPAWRVSGCALTAVAWSGDGRRLAVIDEADNVVLLSSSGEKISIGAEPASVLRLPGADAVALNRDGSEVAVAGTGWGKRAASPPGQPTSNTEGKPWLETFKTGQAGRKQFKGVFQSASTLSFSANGETLLSGSRGGQVRLWDARLGEAITKPTQAHTGEVAAITPAGTGVDFVSVGLGGATRTWPAQPQAWPKLMCDKLGGKPRDKSWPTSASKEMRDVCR